MTALGEWDTDAQPPPPSWDDPRLRHYADALDDATGAVRVAEAKAEAWAKDESKHDWQKIEADVAVEKAERKRQRAELDLEAARAELAIAEGGSAPQAAEDEPSTYFGSADEFMRHWLSTMYSREVGGRGSGRVWRSDWWNVPEALSRIDALWRAWEFLRLEGPTGISVWWRDHADHHMAVLMDPEGPFRQSSTPVRLGEPLLCDPPPEGMFPDERVAPPDTQR